ncbi:MAG TPA: alanine dehydrogenase [Chitinophagaceae bacterium]|nr:alanine dehydrogenase [Chitinophagaceae bacterium]
MEGRSKPVINVSYSYNPLEETLEYAPRQNAVFIGIPKETSFQENRIALTPSAVSVIVSNGHQVVIEHQAGEASSFSDQEYAEAGAMIVHSKDEVFKAGIILKTAPIGHDELDLLKPNQIVFSPIHIPSLSKDQLQKCLEKKIIGIALGSIKDDAGYFPIVRSMSQIAGVYSIQMAAKYLNNNEQGKGILMGGIAGVPPANVVIIGAGMVGEFAARTAIGCGAQVKVFDNSIYRLLRLQRTVGQTMYTSVIDPVLLAQALREADVAIGALKPRKGIVPVVVSEQMVEQMRPGSVIIDVSIDNGGCFETSSLTSHEDPVFLKHDVIHYCVPNMASGVSRTASTAISNILMPLILSCAETAGPESMIQSKPGLLAATYMYKGKLSSKVLSKKFNIKYTDLELILSTEL